MPIVWKCRYVLSTMYYSETEKKSPNKIRNAVSKNILDGRKSNK